MSMTGRVLGHGLAWAGDGCHQWWLAVNPKLEINNLHVCQANSSFHDVYLNSSS